MPARPSRPRHGSRASASTTIDAARPDATVTGPTGSTRTAPSPPSAPLAGPSVADLMRATPSERAADGYKLGLAVEGGGMRGIVSGGMTLALRDLGLIDAFDAFYGTSSGSLNLAYLHGGSDWDALSVYYDHLTAGFVRQQRWNVARPLLDMAYAFDEVIASTVPIGWSTIATLDRPINAVLTNVDGVRSEIHDMRTMGSGGDASGVAYLKAASWLPVLAGPPPVVAGVRYLDGGVLCPDPVYAALDDGCTHVLLLNSSPQGHWPAAPRSRPLLRPVLNRWQPGLGEAYVRSRLRWDADRARAIFGGDVAMGASAVLRVAAPAASHHVERLTMRRDLLLDGARVGYQTITDLFASGRHPYFAVALR
jgi:predicted patatin/cPLA2 family phospholipase